MRDRRGRFARGRSGDPAGRLLLAGEGEALTRKAVELALAGDPRASDRSGSLTHRKVRHRSWRRRVAPVDPRGYSRGAKGGGGTGCISSSKMQSRIKTLPHA